MEERKAECFAASMLLAGVDRYFIELPKMDFVSKIFHCMSAFQSPYKAVLVSLYEYAVQSENEILAKRIKEVFDLEFEDMPQRFQELGLDDSLVKPILCNQYIALAGEDKKKQSHKSRAYLS